MEGTAKDSGVRRLKGNKANILEAKRRKYFKGKMLLSQNKSLTENQSLNLTVKKLLMTLAKAVLVKS